MFKKNALLILCLFFVAVLTSACGGGGSKNTPTDNSALYFLLAQLKNQVLMIKKFQKQNQMPMTKQSLQ